MSSEFELFAVVTHTGKLDAGHYVTYLRLSNQWYKCDDAWVTQVNENIVRAAQGYMIFYVQKMFYYKPSENQVASWCDDQNWWLTRLHWKIAINEVLVYVWVNPWLVLYAKEANVGKLLFLSVKLKHHTYLSSLSHGLLYLEH